MIRPSCCHKKRKGSQVKYLGTSYDGWARYECKEGFGCKKLKNHNISMSRKMLTEYEARRLFWDSVLPVLKNVKGRPVILSTSGDYFRKMYDNLPEFLKESKFKPLLIGWDKERYEKLYHGKGVTPYQVGIAGRVIKQEGNSITEFKLESVNIIGVMQREDPTK